MKRSAHSLNKHKQRYDIVLLSLIFILIIFGVLVLASASSPVGLQRYNDTYHFVKRQIFNGIVPGLVFMAVLSRVPTHWYLKYWKWFYGGTLFLLISVFIPGLAADFGTSSSWIQIAGSSVQPSEFAKVMLIISLAGLLSQIDEEDKKLFSRGLLPFLAVVGSVCGLLIMQPDIGTMVIVVLIVSAMYFVSGALMKHIVMLIGLGSLLLGILIATAPYRLARLMTFLQPGQDLQGAGYQLNQALIAVGSGGLLGLGLGHSRQKFLYLPEVTSDSIFAILSEELGFMIGALFVIVIVYMCMRMLRIAHGTKFTFDKLVVVGVVSWVGFQALINIGAIIGIMPLTGVPLPFVSHGGSAMVALLGALGIVLQISKSTV